MRGVIIATLLFAVSASLVKAEFNSKVEYYHTKCILENNSLSVRTHVRIIVLNKQGEGVTDISIPYQKGQKVTSINGKILTPSGHVIRELYNSQISESSLISEVSLFEDHYVKRFQLKHNQYPYVIEYGYTIKYFDYIFLANWSPALYFSIPTKHAELQVQVPKGFGLNIHARPSMIFERSSQRYIDQYVWKGSYKKPLKKESYSPPLETLIPRVIIIPERFHYGIPGKAFSWSTYGNWQHQLNEGLQDLSTIDKQHILHLVENTEDKRDKIRLLYGFLQENTRYINVSIDVGGLKPKPASYVVQNKYGDCKALTNYMKALLDAAEIPSYYAKIYAGENPIPVKRNLPGQQFNHVILAVPMENDTIWLENTSSINPFAYVGTFIQNRQALLVNGVASRLIKTPSLSSEDVRAIRKVEFEITNNTDLQVKLMAVHRGPQFEEYNYIRNQLSKSDMELAIRKHAVPFKNFELHEWDLVQKNPDRPEIKFQANLTPKHYIKRYGSVMVIPVLKSSIPTFVSPEYRRLPVKINYPIQSTDTLIYRFASNVSVKKTPKDTTINTHFGHYKIFTKQKTGEIVLIKQFLLKAGFYPLDQYHEFHTFTKGAEAIENEITIDLKIN